MKNHFKIIVCFMFVLWMMCINASVVHAYSSGPPFGRTGSPADGFKTCNDTDCHNTYPLNAGTATFSISTPGRYILGEVLSVTVSFKNSHASKHGFELSALDANNNHAGIFSSFSGDNKTQTSTDGNYIEHTFKGCNQSGNARWKVKWTAPSSEVQDPVTFYAAGNEADGDLKHAQEHGVYPKHRDDTHDGDYVYTAIAQISRTSITPTPTPVGCETTAISASANDLTLKKGEEGEVIITLILPEGCSPKEGGMITAKINKVDKKRMSVSPQSTHTDVNGKARFTVTAKQKTGKARVEFRYEDFKTTVKVNVIE